MKRIVLILLLSSFLSLNADARSWMPRDVMTTPRDTTQYGEDDDEVVADTVKRTKRNIAEGFNALDFVMGHRYRAYGEEFTPKWHDHLFFQAGLGALQMVPPNDGYRFNALTMLQVGVGKQFNKLNSARVLFHGAWGYQQAKDRRFTNYGVRLEHLFNFSSYFAGYKPSRLMEMSTIFGIGAQYSRLSYKNVMWEKAQLADIAALEKAGDYEEAAVIRENMPKDLSGTSFEGHFGLQLRFFTGPQGYIHVEPYIGVATDKMDLSTNLNWRKVDVFYGVNVNYTYYLHNNLSPAERQRFKKHHSDNLYATKEDSIPSIWEQPWFFEFSNGPAWMSSSVGIGESMGLNTTMSVGKWFSPVIGLRMSATGQQVTCGRAKDTRYHCYYIGGRLEGLFNPLGFMKNFQWDRRWGFFLAGGIEYGQVKRYEAKELSTRYEAYQGAVNLWWQPIDGLRVFMEPRVAFYVYKTPYTNVSWNKHNRAKSVAVQVGMSVSTRSLQYRKRYFGEESEAKRKIPVNVGLAGGIHLLYPIWNIDDDNSVGWNARAFGEYCFTPLHGVRASFDYLPYKRHDIRHKEHDNNYGLVSLSYALNLSNLFWGTYSQRPIDFTIYMGPTANVLSSFDFGVHGGGKLRVRVMPHLSAILEPTLYVLHSKEMTNQYLVYFRDFHLVENINLGVQYEF